MAKRKNNEPTASTSLKIMSAEIKDGYCNYSYKIVSGIGEGDTHNVKGKGLIDDDMHQAFQKFNAHMAFIDDVFKHSKVEISNIDLFHNHELTGLFDTYGFKVSGSEEDESVILMGTKYVTSGGGGRIELDTPKTALDNLSSYKWYNELADAVRDARNEVLLYINGKYTKAEVEENPKQMKISDLKEEEAVAE